ncbi:MAG: FAD-dependent oxidoreductase, partial [Verrucomicrobiota bacterium]
LGGASCNRFQRKGSSNFDGSVIVVGAGVAGMSAGYLLAQQGVRFSILEAAPVHGGRVKTVHDFVDFPLPLGGEWIHATPDILSQIINDDSVEVATKLAAYDPQATFGVYKNSTLKTEPLGNYPDLKFVHGTWLSFYEQYVLPTIAKQIRFRTEVVEVDYSGKTVVLKDAHGKTHSGDAVILTVPPQIIKDHRIAFVPPLPKAKHDAFEKADLWGGMKVFMEFKEHFYPTFLEIEGTNNRKGQKVFYDAAYGQKSATNVLGLFAVGEQAKVYQARRGAELRDFILDELDQIFAGAASRSYIRHLAQNWSQEEFIRQAYFADSGDWRLPPRMQRPVDRRVFFAGDTYSNGDDWGSVHVAAQSAREAVDGLTRQR